MKHGFARTRSEVAAISTGSLPQATTTDSGVRIAHRGRLNTCEGGLSSPLFGVAKEAKGGQKTSRRKKSLYRKERGE